ncbi:hypothetical protein [Actinomadura sp. 3N508]|uniref:hypothetical protein n=1 Tax=Actinomadura sp. 3N508 TaxID=3375153 RepID=UPI0037B48F62
MATVLFSVIVLVGWHPVLVIYTLVFGERGTAWVADCEGISTGTDCKGTWRTASGEPGAGHISGVSHGDERKSILVRVGPLGPYSDDVVDALPSFILPVIAFGLFTAAAWKLRRLVG